MRIKFLTSMLMNQPYAGSGELSIEESGLSVTGRQLLPRGLRIAIVIPTWIILAVLIAMLLTGGVIISTRTVGGCFQALVVLLVAWSLACALGRKRTTQVIPFSSIRNLKISGHKISLKPEGIRTIRGTLKGKKDAIEEFKAKLQQHAPSLFQ